jgi:hypothetical protein
MLVAMLVVASSYDSGMVVRAGLVMMVKVTITTVIVTMLAWW